MRNSNTKKNDREEALSFDKHAVGDFFKNGTLVSHIPIELSNLIYFFLKGAEENFVSAVAVAPRRREVGLVVSARFISATKKLKVPTIPSNNSLE